tara:strand:+ start:11749 stop:12039 length:291 start_codon:yes stop_codon:yes gene_type:complete
MKVAVTISASIRGQDVQITWTRNVEHVRDYSQGRNGAWTVSADYSTDMVVRHDLTLRLAKLAGLEYLEAHRLVAAYMAQVPPPEPSEPFGGGQEKP